GVCLVAMDGYLHAAGGHDGFTAVNVVENKWSMQPPMLTRRSRAAAAVLQGHLCVIGGNDGESALSSERYNPLDGTWSACSHMLGPMEAAGCAVYQGHIHDAGGKDELNLKLCSAERLDPCGMRWSPVKCMRSKRMSLAVFSGLLLAVGGHDGVSDLKTIDVYEHETDLLYFGSLKSKHPGGRVAVLRPNKTLI
uniref:Si:ch73-29c22.1 n=1 Tax=Oryzias latipes TaxID=8090 RepID=A0A3P9M4X3_ORYLA